MSQAIAIYEYTRGQTITFVLSDSSESAIDGTETVTCDVKKARNGAFVPPEGEAIVVSITPTFVAAAGDVDPAYHFEITASQCEELEVGFYVIDARISETDGHVELTEPIAIQIHERVTGP